MDFGPYLLLASLEGAVMAAVLALTALGLSLVFGVMRIVNVAHGEFFMFGAMLAWWSSTVLGGALGLSPALAWLLALVLAPLGVGLLAYVADALILQRLDYQPEATIVATIGLLYVIQQGALLLFGPDARAVQEPIALRLDLYWFRYPVWKLAVIAIALALLLLVWLVMTRSKWGLIMRATREDSEMAAVFGVPVRRVYAICFTVGAMLAALASVLLVPIQQAHYLMGLDPLLLSFIVVILGGLGSLRGTLIAALVVGMADGILSVFYSPTLAKIIATLVVALVLVFRPQGLFGRAES